MKATYTVAPEEVVELTRKIINLFPDRFIHIKPEDIYFTFKDADTSRWLARTGLIKGDIETMTKKKIRMQIHKQHWENSTEVQRARTIFHELTHITYDDEKNKYRLIRHEFEDWRESVKLFGISDENIEKVFEGLKEKQLA